jgi:hypothetical protein
MGGNMMRFLAAALPPGWRLISASGADDVPDTWFQQWTLFDLFIVLIISVAMARLFGVAWGVLALVAPGFSADCLETLEELNGENRHYFEAGGGEKFAYLPALNDSPEGIAVIEAIVRRELQGWL